MLYCRPPRGGRGLKSAVFPRPYPHRHRRPPRGGRGLKWTRRTPPTGPLTVASPRGGRGLKYPVLHSLHVCRGRPPRGGRGLKFEIIKQNREARGRPPRGGRGLKSWGFDEEDDRCRRPFAQFARRVRPHVGRRNPASYRPW